MRLKREGVIEMKIRIRQADKLFSEYLRKKIGSCEICGKKESIQVSHFYGRRHENTRFSEENCDILCYYHHQNFGENPATYVDWKKAKLGEKRFKLLMLSANQYKKKDDKLIILWLKKELKELT